MRVQITAAMFHRNGISGEPFYQIFFRFTDTGNSNRPMIATLFRTPLYCAVLDHAGIAEGETGQAWRGDNFEKPLRDALDKYLGRKAFD